MHKIAEMLVIAGIAFSFKRFRPGGDWEITAFDKAGLRQFGFYCESVTGKEEITISTPDASKKVDYPTAIINFWKFYFGHI